MSDTDYMCKFVSFMQSRYAKEKASSYTRATAEQSKHRTQSTYVVCTHHRHDFLEFLPGFSNMLQYLTTVSPDQLVPCVLVYCGNGAI